MAEDWEDWIRRQKQQGRTRREVREYLTENGYDASVVDEYWASTELREMEQPTVLAEPGLDTFLDNWRTVFTSPGGFFRRTDADLGAAGAFAVICMTVYAVMSSLRTALISVLLGGGIVPALVGAASWAAYFTAGIVVSGVLYFVLLRLLGGSASFGETMTVMLYSTAPLVLAWLPVIGGLLMLFAIFIQIAGLTEVNDMTRNRVVLAFIIQFILGIIAAVGSVVWVWGGPLLA